MPSKPHYVVAHAPQHPEDVGAIVSETGDLAKHRRSGATLLPIDPVLESDLVMGGFVRRQWGAGGIFFGANRGQSGASLMIQARAGVPYIHWAAGIIRRGPFPRGQLRLATEASSAQLLQCGLSVLQTPAAFDLVNQGESLVVTGSSRLQSVLDGFLGLKLWGVCSDVAVVWVAASQSSHAS